MKLDGYGDFVRAQEWVNDNGGSAYAMLTGHTDKVTVVTFAGFVDAYEGWYVVREGDVFYTVQADIFEASHSLVEEPVVPEPLTGTGLYVIPSPEGATRLVGGAAKQRPRADDGTPLRMDGTTGNWAGD